MGSHREELNIRSHSGSTMTERSSASRTRWPQHVENPQGPKRITDIQRREIGLRNTARQDISSPCVSILPSSAIMASGWYSWVEECRPRPDIFDNKVDQCFLPGQNAEPLHTKPLPYNFSFSAPFLACCVSCSANKQVNTAERTLLVAISSHCMTACRVFSSYLGHILIAKLYWRATYGC